MVYETTTEVMLGVYVKLQKQKDNAMKRMQELTFQIRLLEINDGDPFLIKDLVNKKSSAESKYNEAKEQLDLIQEKRNGGASLDPFLKKEVEFAENK